jgi:hypothetical protein
MQSTMDVLLDLFNVPWSMIGNLRVNMMSADGDGDPKGVAALVVCATYLSDVASWL